MQILGDQTVHYWLAQRMAKITETDLVAAMDRVGLTQEDWAEMVRSCQGCDWSEGCPRWLDRQDKPVNIAPDGCVNRDRFAALKSALEAQEA